MAILLNLVKNSFDSLPELVVRETSVNTFKGCLNAHWDDLKFVVDFPAHELSKLVSYEALVLNFQQYLYPKEERSGQVNTQI